MAQQYNDIFDNNDDVFKRIIADPAVRQELTRKSFLAFWNIYCMSNTEHQYDLAPFQREIINILQDKNNSFFVLEGSRGSAKTSIANQAYAIWSIVGMQQIKYIVIITNTQEQGRQCLTNIKSLMMTEPLRSDMGPFTIPEGEWRSNAIDIPKYDARIIVISIEQQIRGVLHGNIRPQVVICDDLENITSVRYAESRDKLYKTFTSDILPAGDIGTRFIVIGTRLHEDSLIMKLKNSIDDGRRDGIFKSYPIMNENGNILWRSKYPTIEAIEKVKRMIDSETTWQREYMLKIVPDDYQIIQYKDIRYYDTMPPLERLSGIRIGVDLASSKRETADYTSMVVAWIFIEHDGKSKIYIDSLCVNARLDFLETIKKCEELHNRLKSIKRPEFIVEKVGYQGSLPEILVPMGIFAKKMPIGSQDKNGRLEVGGHRIKNGDVFFARRGNEMLINQIVHLGSEKHDDLCDAFTILMLDIIDNPPFICRSISVQTPGKSPYTKIDRDLGNTNRGSIWDQKF